MDMEAFYTIMNERRSYRKFLPDALDMEVIKNCMKVAGTAPSGANKQPWFYAVIRNKKLKESIRKECEAGEKKFYETQISNTWKGDLEKLKVNEKKPFLTEAPLLICCFQKSYVINDRGEKERCYYPTISSSLSIGMLITSIHLAGYQSLTYTPSNASWIYSLLQRPEGERLAMILVVGKKNPSYSLPDIHRKALEEIYKVYD